MTTARMRGCSSAACRCARACSERQQPAACGAGRAPFGRSACPRVHGVPRAHHLLKSPMALLYQALCMHRRHWLSRQCRVLCCFSGRVWILLQQGLRNAGSRQATCAAAMACLQLPPFV
jgi:hypothetical protein